MEMYFKFCDACRCYEYDCHGLEGCITQEPGYKNAHARYKERFEDPARQERLVELVKNETAHRTPCCRQQIGMCICNH